MKQITHNFATIFLKSICSLILFTFLYSCTSQYDDQNNPEYLKNWFLQADTIKYRSGVDASIDFLNDQYSSLPKSGILDKYQKYEYILKMLSFEQPDLPQAMLYMDSMQALFTDKKVASTYWRENARTSLYEGDILRDTKKFNEAHAAYFKGKIQMELRQDTCELNYFDSRIAKVYFDQGRFRQAVDYYKKASDESWSCTGKLLPRDAFHEQASNLTNTGLSYVQINMPDSALIYYKKALAFLENSKSIFENRKDDFEITKAVILGDIGEVYSKQGKYAQAEPLFQQSIAVNSQKGYDKRHAQFTQGKLLHLYLLTGQMDKAYKEIVSLQKSLDEKPNELARIISYDLQSQYYEKVNKPIESLTAYKNYVRLKEALDHDRFKEAGIDQTMKSMENELKISLLSKKAQINRLYLIGTVTFSLMALVIILLIWKNSATVRKSLGELKELNEQISDHNIHMQQALGTLEQSQEQNSLMMKIVAHDLRSPLGAIHMTVLALLEDDNLTHEQRTFLEMIKLSVSNSMQLIGNVLQSNTQTTCAQMEQVSLDVMINYCVNMLKYKADQKEQKIRLETVPILAFVDKEKIWRVFSNLIANAIKFSPSGAPVDVELKLVNDKGLITIHDQGIGIPPDLMDSVFDLFPDGRQTGTAGEQSFGMGLAISRQIVRAHHGRLWFECNKGVGTTFFVELPLNVSNTPLGELEMSHV